MQQKFTKIDKVKGTLELPGDKSISHRSVMFSGLAKGKSIIKNLLVSEDVNSTRRCFQQLGCNIEQNKNTVVVYGRGFKGFSKPNKPLDAGNSGTTARLISGILAAQDFETTLIGDASLSKRPMRRIIDPLSKMGGKFEPTADITLPLIIKPAEKLLPLNYELPVASAQVKSAVLLAALHLEQLSSVTESVPTRNHTENLLNLKTGKVNNHNVIYASKENYPESKEYLVPSDISTAAFFIVLSLLTKNSEVIIKNVGLNETRIGILKVLSAMNANIKIENERIITGEKIGDLIIQSSELKNVDIPLELIPNIIDEIPILSVAGIFAEGSFKITNAKELRFKESDRIKALCHNYRLLGLDVKETEDGFELAGEMKQTECLLESFDDHRIAMSMAVLSLLKNNGNIINSFECVAISNPDFLKQLEQIVQ